MLLCELSWIFVDCICVFDILVWLGGDEFGLLLFDCDLVEVEQVVSKFIEQICLVCFFWEGWFYDVGVSIGIIVFIVILCSISELMSQVDVVCYVVKYVGCNWVLVYQFGYEEVECQYCDIFFVSGLCEVLENDCFQLQVQEIVLVGFCCDGDWYYELLL